MNDLLNEFGIPQDLASCPCCGCVVFLVRFIDGRVLTWDPRFRNRRTMVATIGIATWADWLERGQRWGIRYDTLHECPPGFAPVPAESQSHDVRSN